MTTIESSANSDDLLWQQLKTVPAFRALLRAVEARFYGRVDLPEPVLDVGCGDGHFAQMAFDHPLQVGIDPWWGPLNKAVASGTYELPLQAMGDNLPFPDHSFASAFSNSVLEHIPEVQPVLNEVGRVLQIGAPFVITVPSHYFTEYLGGAEFFDRFSLHGLANNYRKVFNRISRHAHTDPPEVWAERLAQAGFQIERWQYYFSREALHALEIGHAQGVPSAILHALTGRWIIGPYESNLKWTEQWVRPFFEEEFPEQGAYVFFLARKASDSPLAADLPAAAPFTLQEFKEQRVAAQPAAAAAAAAQDVGTGDKAQAAAQAPAPRETKEEEHAPSARGQSSALSLGHLKVISHRWLLLLALVLVFLAPRLTGSGEGLRPFAAMIVWVIAGGLAFYALYVPHSASRAWIQELSLTTVLISIALFAAALIVRLYDLGQHPFILNGTEASLGLDALRVIDGSFRNPFSSGWLTNPTLPLFLLAIPIKLFGPSTFSLRLISPFVGSVTVVAVFLIGQRLYGRAVGIAAAVLLLGSYFHLQYSRLGLTNAWDALLVLLSLGLIAIAWQQETDRARLTWLLAGTATGLSAYLYTSAHLLPLMLLALMVLTLIFDRATWRKQWPNIAAMSLLALIIALPQLIVYGADTASFMARANTLGILDSQSGWLSREAELTGSSKLQILGQQLWSAALAFNATLDTGTYFGPLKPLLNFVSGLLAVLGFFVALVRLRRIQYGILVVWVVTTIVFAGALLVSPPDSHRYIIAAPAVIFLAAIGLVELFGALLRPAPEVGSQTTKIAPWYQRKPFLLNLTLVIAIIIALYDIGFYFGSYRQEHHYADRNTEIADAMAKYLNSLDGDWSAYFYGPPSMYVDFPTIPFLARSFQKDRNLFDIAEADEELPPAGTSNYTFIYLPERYGEIASAKLDFPAGKEIAFDGYYADPLFYVFEVRDGSNSEN